MSFVRDDFSLIPSKSETQTSYLTGLTGELALERERSSRSTNEVQ